MATMNISLPDSMKSFVESQVATGRFSNASDYVRDVIRERQESAERLAALIEDGEASGISPRSLEEIMEGIRGRRASRKS